MIETRPGTRVLEPDEVMQEIILLVKRINELEEEVRLLKESADKC